MIQAIVRTSAQRDPVEEWSLVLMAVGFDPSIEHTRDGFAICVPAAERDAAARALDDYERERASPPARAAEIERVGEVERFAAIVVSLAMLAFFAVTGPRSQSVWFASGSADAARILDGELWRTVTALCLHADLGHVAANALFGALFLSAVCAGFGPGLGVALALAAGAAGNLANAIFQGPGHVSVGASTAVFAAVGLLAGRAVARRLRRSELGFRVWVPVAAGVALIAMLGVGERSDVMAHVFGFAAGGFVGIPASLAWPRRAGVLVQLAAIAGVVALLALAWQRALA